MTFKYHLNQVINQVLFNTNILIIIHHYVLITNYLFEIAYQDPFNNPKLKEGNLLLFINLNILI